MLWIETKWKKTTAISIFLNSFENVKPTRTRNSKQKGILTARQRILKRLNIIRKL